MPKKKRVRVVQISARQMVDTTAAQAIWQTTPAEERGAMPTLSLGRHQSLSDLSLLWERIGGKLYLKRGREKLELILPDPLAMSEAVTALGERTQQADALTEKFLKLSPDNHEYVHEIHARFEQLDAADQAVAIKAVRTVYALCCVQCSCDDWWRRPAGQAMLNRLPLSIQWMKRDRSAREDLEIEISCIQLFFEMIDWSIRSRQLPPDQQFLPPGLWPRQEPEEQQIIAPAQDEQLELGEEAIAADDVRVDTSRDAYYMGELTCLHRLEPQGWFGSRRYVAYIYQAPSKEMIAILDCAQLGNAAYIFRVGTPVQDLPSAWMADAGQTKLVLLTRPHDRRGTFVRRFVHAVGWQTRLRDWLEGTFPEAS